MLRNLRAAAAFAAVTLPLASPTGAHAESATVRLGEINISFYAVAAGVVHELLERLGHTVEVTRGLHPDIFPKLGANEVDVLVAAWLPHGHAEYWSKYGDCCVEVAKLYDGAHFFWAVPNYVPADLVKSVDDLKKPEVLAKMEKLIKGTGPGSGLMIQSRKLMQEYGLTAAGYTLEPSPGREWIERAEAALKEKRWFVTPLWQPQFLNKAYTWRKLAEPRGLLGGENRAVVVMHKSFAEKLPARTLRALQRIELGLDTVSAMDYAVNVEKKAPREVAREWMRAHAQTVDAWLAGP
jgi:glycine betaine/proline transport system substrate-binding protein